MGIFKTNEKVEYSFFFGILLQCKNKSSLIFGTNLFPLFWSDVNDVILDCYDIVKMGQYKSSTIINLFLRRGHDFVFNSAVNIPSRLWIQLSPW